MTTDLDTLLKPISPQAPAGKPLRGTVTYRAIESFLQEDLSGAAQGGAVVRASAKDCAPLAITALSSQTKDLFIAVWLTEALVRLDGFDGLRRGIDLLCGLITNFWDTVYPLPEDGDEEIRGAPLARLTGRKFTLAMEQIAITRDGYTRLDEKILKTIPLKDQIGSNSDLAKARAEAEEQKRVLPEAFAASLRETDFSFYERMAAEIVLAKESVRRLESECNERFRDPRAIPGFDPLTALLDSYEEMALEKMRQKAPPPSQAREAAPPASPREPAAQEPAVREPEVQKEVAPPEPVAEPLAGEQLRARALESEDDAAQSVFAAARYLRQQNPANPAAFLLTRCLHFGAVAGRGAIDDTVLEPPPADLRRELWQLSRDQNWNGLIEKVEAAMELPCGAGWLELQYYGAVALEKLGGSWEPARKMTCDLVRQYVALMPNLIGGALLDGTPCASPAATRWLESLNSDAGAAPEGNDAGLEQPMPDDCFESASRLAETGRMNEAFRVFYAGDPPQDTGRGRFESRLRIASLCMKAREYALSLPALRELRREIQQRDLEEWEPELAAKALKMLHECLIATSAGNEEITEVFARICVIDPLLAVKMGNRK